MTMILLKVDRASMYESLEVRVPLLDKEVVETAARIDWASCLQLSPPLGKLPLRHSLNRYLTHQTHTKRGFTVPMDKWLRGPLRQIFEDVVLSKDDFHGLPIDRRAARDVFGKFLKGQFHSAWGLWLLLSFALWTERHFAHRSLR